MHNIQNIRSLIESLDKKMMFRPLNDLEPCNICPRECNAKRLSGDRGFCKAGPAFNISSICIHRGEEPPISGTRGICNIFFTNCNLQCIYCQNHQISFRNIDHSADETGFELVLLQIIEILERGIKAVGFVSPTHFIPQIKIIIMALRELGYNPAFIYNSNGYDKVDELRKLEGMIDVYLPDFKYMDENVAVDYSDAPGYPSIALNAIKEMYRQVGSSLILNNDQQAESGMLIRHLVLPGQVENSIRVLQEISERISPDISISLMSQYYPSYHVASHPVLGRTLKRSEYQSVVNEMKRLGMYNGWIQDMDSYQNYRPDFGKGDHPFE